MLPSADEYRVEFFINGVRAFTETRRNLEDMWTFVEALDPVVDSFAVQHRWESPVWRDIE